jgi:hypothetical protein
MAVQPEDGVYAVEPVAVPVKTQNLLAVALVFFNITSLWRLRAGIDERIGADNHHLVV